MIVHDIAHVLKFNDLFYSFLQLHEVGFTFMAARRKYDVSLTKNLGGLDRSLVTGHTDLPKALQKFDKVYLQDTGAPIENHAKAYYASLNPRCTKMAAVDLAKEILDDLCSVSQPSNYHRVPSRYLTLVHQSCARKLYKGLDIDDKGFLPKVLDALGEFNVIPYCVIETRGGYHVILHHKSLSKRNTSECDCNSQRCKHQMTFGEYIHKVILQWKRDGNKQAVEFMKDPSSPIPGTFQGGFPVHFLTP